MNGVKWVKLSTDLFYNRKIRRIRSMDHGSDLFLVWIYLLILAGRVNDRGRIYITERIPFTEDSLADEIGVSPDLISTALRTFEEYGMLSVKDGVISLSNWEVYQSADKLSALREYNREAKRKSRERQNVIDKSMTSQGKSSDKNIEKEKDKNKRYIFIAPTLEEVSAYCAERNNGIDAEEFTDFYASRGWMIGKNKMKNWQAAIRNWERNAKKRAESEMTPAEREYRKDNPDDSILDF